MGLGAHVVADERVRVWLGVGALDTACVAHVFNLGDGFRVLGFGFRV